MKHTFKSNINCGGCIAKITPFLEKVDQIQSWEVDIQNIDKILTIESELAEGEIIKVVEEAGFKAVPYTMPAKKKSLFGRFKSFNA